VPHDEPLGAVELIVHLLDEGMKVPSYARHGDAGLDLSSRVDVVIPPGGGRHVVATGIAIALPQGYAGFVLPRSGTAARHGISIVNTPGLIDSGYRGEVLVTLLNTDPTEPFTISRGDRIAQLVVLPVPYVSIVVVNELPPSPGGLDSRGAGGHGSSGR
jgi:dUTP pyrophosphatase